MSTICDLVVLIQPFRAARRIAPMSSNGALCVINQFPLKINSVAPMSTIFDFGDSIIEETAENAYCGIDPIFSRAIHALAFLRLIQTSLPCSFSRL